MDTYEEKLFKKINLFLTGYGPFMSVTESPSQKLVESIFEEKLNLENDNKLELKFNEIFEVDCDYVSNNITKCYDIITQCNEDHMNLILHFGVYPGGNGILLEKQCKN